MADDVSRKNKFVLGKTRGVQTLRKSVEKSSLEGLTDEIRILMDQIEPLLEQVNTLYRQYEVGVERRPPVEQKSRLDTLFKQLTNFAKATPALRFRFNTIEQRYTTMRDRWERIIKNTESGRKPGGY